MLGNDFLKLLFPLHHSIIQICTFKVLSWGPKRVRLKQTVWHKLYLMLVTIISPFIWKSHFFMKTAWLLLYVWNLPKFFCLCSTKQGILWFWPLAPALPFGIWFCVILHCFLCWCFCLFNYLFHSLGQGWLILFLICMVNSDTQKLNVLIPDIINTIYGVLKLERV